MYYSPLPNNYSPFIETNLNTEESIAPQVQPLKGEHFDYIVTGAGCAGLSLVMHLLQSPILKHKHILIIDKQPKTANDRTWCFWEKDQGLFEPIIYKQWQQLWFYSATFSKSLSIAPYTYKLIRGIDFYNFCLAEIKKHLNVTFINAEVNEVFSNTDKTGVIADGKKYYSQFVFNSILLHKPILKSNNYWLLQHFKGWVIETASTAFNASVATFMDFRTGQENGSTFFYVMPFSQTKALVEYTLFSKNVLNDSDYEKALSNYIKHTLNIESYTITEKEFGIIPMTNYAFPSVQQHIVHIGTAGGQTKASSGYTFKFIQKQAAAIVHSLEQTGAPFTVKKASTRFGFYDSVLLHILQHNKMPGDKIFTALFKKNKPQNILQFLDNETSLLQELGLISTLPTGVFLKAAINHTIGNK